VNAFAFVGGSSNGAIPASDFCTYDGVHDETRVCPIDGSKISSAESIWSLGRAGRDDTVENEKCWHENCLWLVSLPVIGIP
jgi:hypothetical protein